MWMVGFTIPEAAAWGKGRILNSEILYYYSVSRISTLDGDPVTPGCEPSKRRRRPFSGSNYVRHLDCGFGSRPNYQAAILLKSNPIFGMRLPFSGPVFLLSAIHLNGRVYDPQFWRLLEAGLCT